MPRGPPTEYFFALFMVLSNQASTISARKECFLLLKSVKNFLRQCLQGICLWMYAPFMFPRLWRNELFADNCRWQDNAVYLSSPRPFRVQRMIAYRYWWNNHWDVHFCCNCSPDVATSIVLSAWQSPDKPDPSAPILAEIYEAIHTPAPTLDENEEEKEVEKE